MYFYRSRKDKKIVLFAPRVALQKCLLVQHSILWVIMCSITPKPMLPALKKRSKKLEFLHFSLFFPLKLLKV